jgi:hypothetical protein
VGSYLSPKIGKEYKEWIKPVNNCQDTSSQTVIAAKKIMKRRKIDAQNIGTAIKLRLPTPMN